MSSWTRSRCILAVCLLLGLGAFHVRGPGALARGTERPHVLLSVSAIGSMSTRIFHADGDWDLQYSTTCRGQAGHFSITTYHGDGSYGDLLENLVTKRLAKTQYLHDSGDWYLVIEGDCPWRLTATGNGRAASTKPPGGKTLLSVSGTGQQSTKRFTASRDWAISYTFACRGTTGHFSITTYHGNGHYGDLLENLVISKLAKTQYLHGHGSWYLKIDGDCPWKVTVKG